MFVLKMVAVSILSNYHVHLVEGHTISPGVSIVLHMKHGLKVRVTKRSFCGQEIYVIVTDCVRLLHVTFIRNVEV